MGKGDFGKRDAVMATVSMVRHLNDTLALQELDTSMKICWRALPANFYQQSTPFFYARSEGPSPCC